MNIVIDFQGFKDNDNKYIIKELAISGLQNNDLLIHKIVAAPYAKETLNVKRKREAEWITVFYHGLDWNCQLSDETYKHMMYKLKELCYLSDKIFVKGEEKAKFIEEDVLEIKGSVTELGKLGCPKLFDLPTENVCVIHEDKMGYICALDNVCKLKKWIEENCYNSEITASSHQKQVKYVKLSERAFAPTRRSLRAAGFDLRASHDMIILPAGKGEIRTDLQIQVPDGCYGRIAPLTINHHHIQVGSSVIDADYRGNVCVVLFNHAKEEYKVKRGDKICQLICEKIEYPELKEVNALTNTQRAKSELYLQLFKQ